MEAEAVGPGEATRYRLIEAAVRIFGERGYGGASTREIAAAASTNPASIFYHFGGKEGLYRAAAMQVAVRGEALLAAGAEEIASMRAGEHLARVDRFRVVFGAYVRAFLELSSAGYALFIAREQMEPRAGFRVLYDGYLREVREQLMDLVADATGETADSRVALMRSHALVGMGLSFVPARETLLRTDLTDYSQEIRDEIVAVVSDMACRALGLEGGGADRWGGDREEPAS